MVRAPWSEATVGSVLIAQLVVNTLSNKAKLAQKLSDFAKQYVIE